VLLDGLPALQFVEQVLPQLAPAGVRVRLEGEIREYRKTNSQPTVQVAAVERANSADWFDLHIKVAIDDEVVPFEELFVALTQGEDFLIWTPECISGTTRFFFRADRGVQVLQDRHRPAEHQPVQAMGRPDEPGVAIDPSARRSNGAN
jgi:hypothetical protein